MNPVLKVLLGVGLGIAAMVGWHLYDPAALVHQIAMGMASSTVWIAYVMDHL